MTQHTTPIRFALVGTGSIAGFHAKAIGMVEGAQLVAAHSRGRDSGETFCAGWKCDYEPTLESLLARPDVDVVCITTPSGTHAEIGVACARAGKHILVEKPVDISVARIDELLQACETANVRLGAIFQARFGEGALAAKRALDEGRLGVLAQAGGLRAVVPLGRILCFGAVARNVGVGWGRRTDEPEHPRHRFAAVVSGRGVRSFGAYHNPLPCY